MIMTVVNRSTIWVLVIFVVLLNGLLVTGLNKEEKRKLKAAKEENASLVSEVEAYDACTARVDELDYHNNALEMISKQQLPKAKEKAEKAIKRLEAVQVVDAKWRFYFSISMLAVLTSLGCHSYSYVSARISAHEEQMKKDKKERKAAKVDRKRK